MTLQDEIFKFRAGLLRAMPFYGEILMRLPLEESRQFPTAATNGSRIFWNPDFMQQQSEGARNFILMHELLHVLLRHCQRIGGRDPQIWNIANDLIVNSLLLQMKNQFTKAGIAFEKPASGLFGQIPPGETSENLYQRILDDNKERGKGKNLKVRGAYGGYRSVEPTELNPSAVPKDLLSSSLTPEEQEAANRLLDQLIRDAMRASPGLGEGGSRILDGIIALTGEKRLNWKQVLRNLMTDVQDGDASYATPERKYLHMDMILPDYGSTEPAIEEVWAFVDSSGSVSDTLMKRFLSELYHLVRDCRCVLHLVYWDTQVREVYRDLQSEREVLASLPHSRGGTDINAVYRWLRENKEEPDILLILTDGCFGTLTDPGFRPQMKARTVLILSERRYWSADMKRIGKVVELT